MAGFRLAGLQEPQHPQSPVPQSLLLVAEQNPPTAAKVVAAMGAD
jgi:hypothetical protein